MKEICTKCGSLRISLSQGIYYGDSGTKHTGYCLECEDCMNTSRWWKTIEECQEQMFRDVALFEQCRSVLRNYEPEDLILTFLSYCRKEGIRKYDGRRNDNSNTYWVGDGCYRGNKCELAIYNANPRPEWGDSKLYLVMRKRNGIPYFIIATHNGDRIVEIGLDTVWCFDGDRLRTFIRDYKPLFDSLGITGVKE